MSINHAIVYRKLHGSISEVYRDLPGSDLPSEWAQEIPGGTDGMLAYLAQNTPRNHCFLRVNAMGRDLFLRSVCSKSEFSVAQTYYSQKYLLDLSPDQVLNRFGELLQVEFYSEEAFNRAAVNAFEKPGGYVWSDEGMELRIPDNTLKAVLYGMLFRWYRKRSPVVVVVPEGVDYDAYTCAAVKAIYSYLPAGLRCLMGFMTYANPTNISEGVALVFVPAGQNYPGAILLDGTTTNIDPLLKNGLPQNAKDMFAALIGMEPEERKQVLEDITSLVETGEDGKFVALSDLYITNYTKYWLNQSKGCENLNDPEDFALLKAFASGQQRVSPHRAEQYTRMIREEVKGEHLDRHFLDSARKLTDPVDFYRHIKPWLPLCTLTRNQGPENLETYVWAAFWSFCEKLVREKQYRTELEKLDAQVRAALVEKNADEGIKIDSSEVEPQEPYAAAYQEKDREIRLKKLELDTRSYEEKIREDCRDLENFPEYWYKTHREKFLGTIAEYGFGEQDPAVGVSLRKLELTYEKALASFEESLTEWFKEGLSVDKDLFTQAEYDALVELMEARLKDKQVMKAPESIREKLEELCEERKKSLKKILDDSAYQRAREIQEIMGPSEKNGYFASMENLLEKKSEIHMADRNFRDHLDKIRKESRPGDLNSYRDEYRRHFENSICVSGVAEKPMAPYIAEDLKQLKRKEAPYEIIVDHMDLQELKDHVYKRFMIELYLSGEMGKILLKNQAAASQYEGNTTHLLTTLQGLLGVEPYRCELKENEFKKLLKILGMQKKRDYRVLRYLYNLERAPGSWQQQMYTDELASFINLEVRTGLEGSIDSFGQLFAHIERLWEKRGLVGMEDHQKLTLNYMKITAGNQQVKRTGRDFRLDQLYTTLSIYMNKPVDGLSSAKAVLNRKDQEELSYVLIPVMNSRDMLDAIEGMLCWNRTDICPESIADIYINALLKANGIQSRVLFELFGILRNYGLESKFSFGNNPEEVETNWYKINDCYRHFDARPESNPFGEGETPDRWIDKLKALVSRRNPDGGCSPKSDTGEGNSTESDSKKKRTRRNAVKIGMAALLIGILIATAVFFDKLEKVTGDPEPTKPSETQIIETEPIETEPGETEPDETEPDEAGPMRIPPRKTFRDCTFQ